MHALAERVAGNYGGVVVYFDAGGFACDRDERDQAILDHPGGNDHGKGEPLLMLEMRSRHTHPKRVPTSLYFLKRDMPRVTQRHNHSLPHPEHIVAVISACLARFYQAWIRHIRTMPSTINTAFDVRVQYLKVCVCIRSTLFQHVDCTPRVSAFRKS